MSAARPIGLPSSGVDLYLNPKVTSIDKSGEEIETTLLEALEQIEGVRKAFHQRLKKAYAESGQTSLEGLQEKQRSFERQYKILQQIHETAVPILIQAQEDLQSGNMLGSSPKLKEKVAKMAAQQSELQRHLEAEEWVATLTHHSWAKYRKVVSDREAGIPEREGALTKVGKGVVAAVPYVVRGGVCVVKTVASAPAVPLAATVAKDYLLWGQGTAVKTAIYGTAALVYQKEGYPLLLSIAGDLSSMYGNR